MDGPRYIYWNFVSSRKDKIEDAKNKGATVVELNPANEDFSQQPHHKIPPTIILNPTEDMQVMQEEIFGPVLSLIPYEDDADAVKIANDTVYGLSAYVSAASLDKAKEIGSQLRAGNVHFPYLPSPGDFR